MRSRLVTCALAAALIASASSSEAAPIFYNSRAAWELAVGGFQTLQFEGAPDNSYVGAASPYQELELNVIPTTPQMYLIGPDYAESGGTFGVGSGDILFSYAPGLQVTGDVPFYAAGFDARGYLTSSMMVTLIVSGFEYQQSVVAPAGGFIGFVSDAPLAAFAVLIDGHFLSMDNLSYATEMVAPVPEPASLLLVGGGVAGVIMQLRRRRAQQA